MTVTSVDTPTRCGFVALLGAPNAGKSTLINALVGSKVSIVTQKAQTTRAQVRGIVMVNQTQLIFTDTPGIFSPKRRLDRAMIASAWSGAQDADVVVLLIDARRGLSEDVETIVSSLAQQQRRVVLVLNKIDLVERSELLALTQTLSDRVTTLATFMISALEQDGVEDLKTYLAEHVPFGPWHFPDDQLSDMPMRLLAAEITREKLFLRLHDELPYQLTVETTAWKNLKDGAARIEQTIYVGRDGHKKIILGKNGETIRTISMAARKEMTHLFEHPVHLFLFVKVRENWSDDPERYREMGLEFPAD